MKIDIALLGDILHLADKNVVEGKFYLTENGKEATLPDVFEAIKNKGERERKFSFKFYIGTTVNSVDISVNRILIKEKMLFNIFVHGRGNYLFEFDDILGTSGHYKVSKV